MLIAPFESVRFPATDGVRLAAWWIPACRTARTDGHPAHEWGQDTVILCPGLGADKASQLPLVRDLVPNGYNVLALDFRAHGESEGHFSTFGDLERRDVLGAVRWVRTHHADEARRILGLGVNTGAAALVGAAADSGPEGQAIDAVAVFEPFDDLPSLVTRISEDHLLPLPGWATVHLALPIAGAQLGTKLGQWSPRHDIQFLWPRPLLVIQGETDPLFPSSSARSFYDAAQEPKYSYWPEKMPRDKLLFSDKRASLMVRIFFGSAREMI